jgi:hypothetical protein
VTAMAPGLAVLFGWLLAALGLVALSARRLQEDAQ